jgi:hypothetical protein
MYLYTNRAGWDIVVPIELSENLLLNLRIISHDFWPPYLFDPVSWRAGPLGGLVGPLWKLQALDRVPAVILQGHHHACVAGELGGDPFERAPH